MKKLVAFLLFIIITCNAQNKEKDSVLNNDTGNEINDSFTIKNGTKITIEDDNCLSLKDKKNIFIFKRCFENSIIRIRHIKGDFIPLTIISGHNSMVIDFFNKNNDWISNSITYYKSSFKGEIKKTKQITVSLKKFDFDIIAQQFGNMNNNEITPFNYIKNKEKLMQLDIYEIADILKTTPVSKENVMIYNDAALKLIEGENFNEARIILLDIVNFSPHNVNVYLDLGDAQWGFDDKEKAKESYQKYISLMKSQGKDLNKIPKRVYDRAK